MLVVIMTFKLKMRYKKDKTLFTSLLCSFIYPGPCQGWS